MNPKKKTKPKGDQTQNDPKRPTQLLQGPFFIAGMLRQQLQGEAQGGRCGFVPGDHQIHHVPVEGAVAHALPIRVGILQHGSDDGVLTQLTKASGFHQIFHLRSQKLKFYTVSILSLYSYCSYSINGRCSTVSKVIINRNRLYKMSHQKI